LTDNYKIITNCIYYCRLFICWNKLPI